MTWLFESLIANSLIVCLLAALVYVVARLWHRPQVMHVLWLIVLFKFITPPLIALPSPLATTGQAIPIASFHGDIGPQVEATAAANTSEAILQSIESSVEEQRFRQSQRFHQSSVSAVGMATLGVWGIMGLVIAGIWFGGACWIIRTIVWDRRRTRHFLANAQREAGPLQSLCDKILRQTASKRGVEVLLTTAKVSPFAWASLSGQQQIIVLPKRLLEDMQSESKNVILLHELAHLQRGDQFVRSFEQFLSVIFWWHPVFWFSSSQLHRTADQCCDAWVTQLAPEHRKTYAEALLDTIDFLAEAVVRVPKSANGIGEVNFLKRRVRMILKSSDVPLLGWKLRTAVAIFALGVLPLSVSLFPTQSSADESASVESEKPSITLTINGETTRHDEFSGARQRLARLGKRIHTAEGIDSFSMNLKFLGHDVTYREPREAYFAVGRIVQGLKNLEREQISLSEIAAIMPKQAPPVKTKQPTSRPPLRSRDGIGTDGSDGLDGVRGGVGGIVGKNGRGGQPSNTGQPNQPARGGAAGLGGGNARMNAAGAGGVGGVPGVNGGAGASGAAGAGPLGRALPNGRNGNNVQGTNGRAPGANGAAAQGQAGASGKSFQPRTTGNPSGAYRTGDPVHYTRDEKVRLIGQSLYSSLRPGFSGIATHLSHDDQVSRYPYRYVGDDVQTATLHSRQKYRDYEKATFSFQHGIRDDPRGVTYNDWDLQYGNGGDYFHVTMVSDDRSRIVDLGRMSWSDVDLSQLPELKPNDQYRREKVAAKRGHMYLVHTVDRHSDHFAIFRVQNVYDGQCTFEWRRLESAARGR